MRKNLKKHSCVQIAFELVEIVRTIHYLCMVGSGADTEARERHGVHELCDADGFCAIREPTAMGTFPRIKTEKKQKGNVDTDAVKRIYQAATYVARREFVYTGK